MTSTAAPPRPTRSLRRRRACTAWGLATLAAFTTLGGGTGCTTWNPGPVPPGGAPTAHVTYDHPVRLRFTNGNTVVLTHARVVGDSLVGDVEQEAFNNAGAPPQRYAAALGDVRGLEQQYANGAGTALLVAIPVLAVVIAVVVAASSVKVGCGNCGIVGVVRPATHRSVLGRTGTVGVP